MRSPEEIQDAHDFLAQIVLGVFPDPCRTHRQRDQLSMALQVLCWVLEHKEQRFEDVLNGIARYIAKRQGRNLIPAQTERVQ